MEATLGKLSTFLKVMKEVEKQKKIEEAYIVKQMGDEAEFFASEWRANGKRFDGYADNKD